jgi:hypothetical protein
MAMSTKYNGTKYIMLITDAPYTMVLNITSTDAPYL